jgi:hypothetical protein
MTVLKRLLMLSLFTGCLAVDAAETSRTPPSGVALAVVGDLSEADVERVRSFVEFNSAIPVRLLEPQSSEQESLVEILDELAPLRTPEHACVVFLYAGERSFEEHTVYRYEAGIGVVNATLMVVDDEERYLRRLEKLTIRSVALLLDVPLVPNPQSALWTYRTMEELDAMGRNLDPPSLLLLQQKAHELGLPLIGGSPYLMVEPRK